MNNILNTVSSYLALGFIVVLLGIFVYQNVMINMSKKEIEKLEAQKSTLNAQIIVLTNNVKQLHTKIDEQNAAIEKMRKDAEEKEKQNQEMLERASATADTYKKQAQELLRRKPPPNMTKCEAANDLINTESKKSVLESAKRGK